MRLGPTNSKRLEAFEAATDIVDGERKPPSEGVIIGHIGAISSKSSKRSKLLRSTFVFDAVAVAVAVLFLPFEFFDFRLSTGSDSLELSSSESVSKSESQYSSFDKLLKCEIKTF